uniref:C-X-C motif chemokine receptor 3 n=1 Tax=Oncorhynchus kisutch TaxID=8019 RepID=A0A8C7IRT6_ONCKI
MDSLMVNGEKFTINISVSDLEYYYDKEYSNYTDTSDTCCSTGEVCSLEEGMSFDAVFLPVFYSLTLVLRLLGNGLVLLVLVQRRRGWSVTDTFILHLCVADILLLLTLPLWAAQAAEEWSFGTPLCKITGAIFTINFYCGIFLLACISLDRYLSVVHAVQMYSRRKPWMVQASCLSVWLLSILLSIPDWHFLESVMDTRRDKQECVHNYPSLSQSGFDWRLASRLLYHTVGFLLPSAVLLFCYSCILLRLQRGSQGLQKQRAVRQMGGGSPLYGRAGGRPDASQTQTGRETGSCGHTPVCLVWCPSQTPGSASLGWRGGWRGATRTGSWPAPSRASCERTSGLCGPRTGSGPD